MFKRRLSFTVQSVAKCCVNLLLVLTASAFNIEHRLPIVKTGPKDSLFGLSVAQHHISAGITKADNAVLLVGAPTAERDAEHSVNAVKPGGLYKCPVSLVEDCARVIVTPKDDTEDDLARQLYPDRVNSLRTNSSNQWLGVTVKSQRPGGKIAVCAHRYTIRGGSRNLVSWEAAIGRCFLLENTVKPVADRLSFEWVPCLGKQDNNGAYTHLTFGYCQAGTAIDFADFPKSSKTEEFLVFGAPGTFSWTGSFYTTQLNPDLFPVNLWTSEVPDSYPKDIRKNGLLGSSLASGVLLDDKVNYVSGAPGSNATGAVVIFENARKGTDDLLQIVEIIEGDTVASRFGHEVQLVDVTGDKRLDLIVGAPQYYDRDLKHGGAIYIYVNKGLGKIGPEPTQKLFGTIDSSFGISITNLGDVNMDGADDIAVGAPGADKGAGSIYIFHGNNQEGTIGVYEDPSQIISAKELVEMGYMTQNITGMGYSVSAGLDMDFNGYPDIAAGSLSDTIVMFQTRPIVNVAGNIQGTSDKITLGEGLVTKPYPITICLKYTSTPATFDEEVLVTSTVKLDTDRLGTELLPRASFSDTDKSKSVKAVNMTLYRQSKRKEKCRVLDIYIDKDLQDKLSPIKLELSFTTPNNFPKRKRRDASLPTPSPIMNVAIENSAVAIIEFSKECGPDEICKSKLSMSAFYEVLRKDWEKIEENEEGKPVLKLGTEQQIGMMITIQNPLPGEDAHQAELTMELPDVLEYRSIQVIKPTPDLHCDPETINGTQFVKCSLGNPFRSDSVTQFRVKLSKNKRAIYQATGFKIRLQLHTTSQQPGHDIPRDYPVIVHVEAQLDVRGYPSADQVKFGGVVIGESAVKQPADAGDMHTHHYEVENTGTGPAENVLLNIEWPQTISNGKWLFYLLQADVRGDTGNCTLPPEVNPLKLKYVPGRRRKREADVKPEASGDPVVKEVNKAPASSYEELICPESATCVKFQCNLGTLKPEDTRYIDLRAILWNSTFLEEYKGVSEIQVQSSATVSIAQQNIKFSDKSKLSSIVATSVLSEVVIAPEEEVKLWVIAVASLAGILLLIALVLLLWKCGFFKRRKFGDYQKARRHKQASKKADERQTLY